MEKSISREVAEKYIDGYFRRKYRIRENAQPNFWEAVKELAMDIDADVSILIEGDEKNAFCVPSGCYSSSHVKVYGVETVMALAKKIAQQIIEIENTPVSPVEVFLMEKRIEELEERMGYSEARYRRYK